ncbi:MULTISPECIES: right-handed parallel beta-helix repeat-containing protein [Haloarcula]|uniref:right-handed parallel beta-helix repeat-containing protein n=1 Tax=Haloarcula TaxID=2237 RepID=UPI0023EC4456|nr:right-handed parallel beta-helix repeat-containing protein [Halomicroarcula sp. XH51]
MWLEDTTVEDMAVATAVVVVVSVAVGSFAVDVSAATPDPVPFEDTVELGASMETEQAAAHRDLSIPKAEIFYSQYRFVVGYAGVGQAVAALNEPGREQQFGYPLAVYVSDYSEVTPTCRDDGSLTASREPDWVTAQDATFVVGSDARVPSGPVVVPFASPDSAAAFADRCGGETVDWATLRERDFELLRATDVREQVDDRRAQADRRVEALAPTLDRPVSVVVGRDAPTIQAAIDSAPPNTTVLVPAGTYREGVRIAKPVTVRGQNASIVGSGNGTVVRVTADRVALTGLSISGVGNATLNRSTRTEGTDGTGGWDTKILHSYGGGDAGVAAVNASSLLVADVTVETPANGILLRRSEGTVVRDVTVDGTAEWRDGFMGVIAMNAPVVVQDSTFRGGRDGVYLHRAHGTVVRNNTFLSGRFGTHLMYTSDALISDNRAREQLYSGIVVMTEPTGNAVVGNDVRHAGSGIATAGSRSYVAENVVVDTRRGITTNAIQSLYEHNVLYDNDVGVVAENVIPSNRVVANDFVANDRHATAGTGPLRIYTHDGQGNYWSGAYDMAGTGATLDRGYSPTDAVDRQLHRTDAAVTLSAAPSVRGVRALRGTTPGFRKASIVDLAPLRDPANPRLLASARNETETGGAPA